MNKHKEMYKSKLCTMDEAAAMIRDGEQICCALGGGQPFGMFEAIGNRVKAGKLIKPSIFAGNVVVTTSLNDPDNVDKIDFDTPFVGPYTRAQTKAGYFTYSPIKLSDMDAISAQKLRSGEVYILRVSPMDQHGFFSTGINVDYGWGQAKANPDRRLFILEVNSYMPRTYGTNHVHVSEIDVLVENHVPLPSIPNIPLTDVEIRIGENIAEMVPDEATIQLGIGGIPNAVGRALINKRDLGVHTEMITESMLDLYEAGVITSNKKTFMPYKWVAAFAWGTQRLYDFLNENPLIEMHTCGLVNDPFLIAKNDKMISVNSTMQMDLVGQCASEAVGPVQFSGVGGQADFVMGAWLSKGGKSFIALPSTYTDKTGQPRSKIVPSLDYGSFVSTTRADLHWVVTEYGAVLIKGQNIKRRVELLISIAHPDFRDELRFGAKKMGYI
ncbi:MAG: acetyl-CoA hydrolase [Syntrophomonadaceae bacterium]|nr:acetyl-CoA hydrolase [Syntrophomonadaceae bacterium]